MLKISGQQADEAKAARGDELFHDGTKGNCNDCHENDGVGNLRAWLDESDRAGSISTARIVRRSSNRSCADARGTMPAFDGQLRPEEIKAVAIYLYYRALPPP